MTEKFDQVKMSSEIRSSEKKQKKSFDQMPNLTENFDQLKMSSEIWSSDHFPFEIEDSKCLQPKIALCLLLFVFRSKPPTHADKKMLGVQIL